MVKIRLKRLGSKFNACYKIVVADSRAPRDGKFIEALGQYNPHSKEFVLNEEATQKWINNGAQLTQTVFNLFRKHKLNAKFMNNTNKEATKTEEVTKKPVKKETAKSTVKPASKTTTTKKIVADKKVATKAANVKTTKAAAKPTAKTVRKTTKK
ncbi:30S ribosomal protein S16 [Mycoplasmopsis caviae]|uniref:Small ribosomal subunit protein bS16 n=1 Tax=Mycoplasmopsis caviae TaxID=55603 RepID=A0A3P8L721_9BACT|nr:30S ribosomal protein S16 [Mycoplasmopsis caviae]VDR41915.1 30S ribosomal protein S16 [Mycoplasmopsis caviae]